MLAPRLCKSRPSPARGRVRAGAGAAVLPGPPRGQRAAAVGQKPDLAGRAIQAGRRQARMSQRGQGHRLNIDQFGLAGCRPRRRERSPAGMRTTFQQIPFQPADQVSAVVKRNCILRSPSRQREQPQILGQADERSRCTTWLPMGRMLTQLRRSYSPDALRLLHPPKSGVRGTRGSKPRRSRGPCQTYMQVPYSSRTYAQVLSECSRDLWARVLPASLRRPARAPTGAVKETEKMAHSCGQVDKKGAHVRRCTGRPVRVSPPAVSRGASCAAHRRIAPGNREGTARAEFTDRVGRAADDPEIRPIKSDGVWAVDEATDRRIGGPCTREIEPDKGSETGAQKGQREQRSNARTSKTSRST